jgi:hypothetical protein
VVQDASRKDPVVRPAVLERPRHFKPLDLASALRALARDRNYEPEVETALEVAVIVDAIYGADHG